MSHKTVWRPFYNSFGDLYCISIFSGTFNCYICFIGLDCLLIMVWIASFGRTARYKIIEGVFLLTQIRRICLIHVQFSLSGEACRSCTVARWQKGFLYFYEFSSLLLLLSHIFLEGPFKNILVSKPVQCEMCSPSAYCSDYFSFKS